MEKAIADAFEDKPRELMCCFENEFCFDWTHIAADGLGSLQFTKSCVFLSW